MTISRPFRIDVPGETLDRIRTRVGEYPWHEMPDDGGWAYGANIESVYSMDSLLTNIMVYLVTGTFNTASWVYYGRREEGGRVLSSDGKRVEVPTAAALFPAEILSWPPRSYVERVYNIARWTEMPCGGHFAALEQPDLLVNDIRAFARTLR